MGGEFYAPGCRSWRCVGMPSRRAFCAALPPPPQASCLRAPRGRGGSLQGLPPPARPRGSSPPPAAWWGRQCLHRRLGVRALIAGQVIRGESNGA
eukprot:9191726-Pyramimonas_sp.AAC.1